METREFLEYCSPEEYILRSKGDNYKVWFFKNPDENFWQSGVAQPVFDRLYRLTQIGFVREPSDELKTDTKNHIFGGEFICLIECQKEILAYAVLKSWQSEFGSILYLSGIMVDSVCQGKRISSSLMKFLARLFGSKFFTLRTQSPVMYQSVEKAFGRVFPSLNGDVPIPIIRQVGEFTARTKLGMQNYQSELMIEKGTYSKCLYGIEPVSSSLEVENFFKAKVNLQRGDSAILVGVDR